MSDFPRTMVGGVSVSRMLIGSNWLLGYSHQSVAKDHFIKEYQDAKRIADVFEVFLNAGIDTTIGWLNVNPVFVEGIQEAQQRTGKKVIVVDTPSLPVNDGVIDFDGTAYILDQSVENGVQFLMPHQCFTDIVLDRTTRTIRGMDKICEMIRERGMIPGLSTHLPESIIYSDESHLDVESYIQIYNALGFLMPVEVEWIHQIIQDAAKPVLTIKPMAAGRLSPLVGLAFVWSTIRDQDMVAVGAMTPDEAKEDIEISLSLLERRSPDLELQRTRSKASLIRS